MHASAGPEHGTTYLSNVIQGGRESRESGDEKSVVSGMLWILLARTGSQEQLDICCELNEFTECIDTCNVNTCICKGSTHVQRFRNSWTLSTNAYLPEHRDWVDRKACANSGSKSSSSRLANRMTSPRHGAARHKKQPPSA